MSGEILYFRGATLGELEKNYGIGGSAGYNVTAKTRMQPNTYAPIVLPDKLVQTSPTVTQLSFETITLDIVSRAATVTDVQDDIDAYVGKVGVLMIGSTVISNQAYCASVGLSADHEKGYKKAWNFASITGTNMTYYNEIKNGGFEACDDSSAPHNWTITAATGADIIITPVRGTEGIGSGSLMLKYTCPNTPGATTNIKQSLGVAKADDTTDNYFLKFSVDAMFESGATTQTTSGVVLQIIRNTTTLSQVDFELVSNIPQKLSIACSIGLLYHVSETVYVAITASTKASANDILYFDNAKVEEVYTTELY